MKKRNKFIICLILIFTLSFNACNFEIDEEQIKEDISKIFDSIPDKPNIRDELDVLAKEVMRCFVNKDAEKLYPLLSIKAQNESNLNNLKEKKLFIEGDIISYDEPQVRGPSSGSYEEGKKMAEEYDITINNIITSENKKYEIAIQYWTVNNYNTDRVGLDLINIFPINENGRKFRDKQGEMIYYSIG
ncbi:MAG: DUF5104 domain-containing protein [Oscillospiraceae bacterium]|nr:DUF5104 domain-containing protein [Oscillospiraceae bacterium]